MRDDERTLFVVCLVVLCPMGNFGDDKLHERPGICRDLRMPCGDVLAEHRMQTTAREPRGQSPLDANAPSCVTRMSLSRARVSAT